jgi:hypothetical protein
MTYNFSHMDAFIVWVKYNLVGILLTFSSDKVRISMNINVLFPFREVDFGY